MVDRYKKNKRKSLAVSEFVLAQVADVKDILGQLATRVDKLSKQIDTLSQRIASVEAVVTNNPSSTYVAPSDLLLTRVINEVKKRYNEGLVDEYDDIVVFDVFEYCKEGVWGDLTPNDVIGCLKKAGLLRTLPGYIDDPDNKLAIPVEKVWE